MHRVLYLVRLSTAVEITYHYSADVIIYFVAFPQKSFAVWVRRSARSADCLSTRSPTSSVTFPPSHPPLTLCDIHDGPGSPKRPSLSKSQQDSQGFRSERKRDDETTPGRQEHRTERYLESARVDRFRTSISLIRARLNALVESWMWPCGSFLVADIGIG